MEALRQAAQFFRNGSHQQAHALLEEVQQTPSPEIVNIGMAILNEPLVPESCYLHFYAARVVRGAVVRDWSANWKSSSDAIVSFVLQFLSEHASQLVVPLFKPLLHELATLWSVTWKLRCGDGAGCSDEALALLTTSVGSIITWHQDQSAVGATKVVLRVLLINCIEEFGLFHASSQSRVLPVSSHECCRRSFKERVLHPLAEQCFAWGIAVQQETPQTAPYLAQLWHAILCWNFANVSIAVSASNEDRIPEVLCCEGEPWQRLLGASGIIGGSCSLVELCATWYNAFQTAQDVASRDIVLQCLVQLCGVTGVDWPVELRVAHFDRMIGVLFGIMQKSLQQEAADVGAAAVSNTCCSGLHRLVSSIGCVDAVFGHPQVVSTFILPLQGATERLIILLHSSSTGHDDNSSNEQFIEALDSILRTWLELVRKTFADVSVLVTLEKTELPRALADSAAAILRAFVQFKLLEANPQPSLSAATDDAPETCHSKEYAESQTHLIALLGREQPAATAQFLTSTLQNLMGEFLSILNARQPCSEVLSEALWFVLSIAAHFVADGGESERSGIPNPIVALALQWERLHPDDDRTQESSNEVFALMRLVVSFTSQLLPSLSSGLVSPGVCQALLQVLRHVCGAYVFPGDCLDLDCSQVFFTAFEGGVVVADCALQLCANCLTVFAYDADVTGACTKLLGALTSKPAAFGEWAVSQPTFGYLVRLASNQVTGASLPGAVNGHVLGFLVSVCPLSVVTATVIDPTVASIGAIIQRAAGTPTGQLQDIGRVVDAVDSLAGAFTALRTDVHTRTVFASFAPLVDASAIVVQHHALHKPLLASILRMMNTIVVSCSFLASSSFVHVVELGMVCIRVTKVAMDESRLHATGLSKEAASQEEDERVDVLTAAATFVESVATWGLLDLNCDDGFQVTTSRADSIAELSVHGLLMVLSFSDSNVLAIPQLRDTVFSLLQEVSSTYTARFLSVSSDEANCLLAATEFALASHVPSLNRSGYKVMESIAVYCLDKNVKFSLLSRFLQSVAGVMAAGEVDSSVYPAVASALFALAAACAEEALPVLLETFTRTSPLLAAPFEQLQRTMQSTNFASRSREIKNKFLKDIEKVLLAVRGTRIA